MIRFCPIGVAESSWYSWLSAHERGFDAANANVAGPRTRVDVLVNRSTGELLVAPRYEGFWDGQP